MRLFNDKRKTEQDIQPTKENFRGGIRQGLLGIKEKLLGYIHNKSFRKKYKYYYALTFAIPIIVIILANMITQKAVKDQVISSNEKTLKQFFRLVDERIEMMIDDAYKIAMRQELQEYAGLSEVKTLEDVEKRLSVVYMLNGYYIGSVYEDIFVWFSDSDRVISGINPTATSWGKETYNQSYYSEDSQMQWQLDGIVQQDKVYPVFWPIKNKDGKSSFALSLNRYWAGSRLKNYVVTLVTGSDFADTCVGEGILAQGENAMLFNRDGELLFSYQTEGFDHLPERYRSAGIYETKEKGRAYTLLVVESESMDGYYAMAISHDIFFEPLSRIRTISYVGILLSVIIGIFVTFKMSSNTYRPLELVLAQFQDNMNLNRQFEPDKHNEFEFIAEQLNKKGREESFVRDRKKREEKAARRKELLLVALEGKAMNETELEFLENRVDLSGQFYGGIIQLKSCGKAGWDMISFIMGNVFEEIFQESCSCDILTLSAARQIIVLGLKREVSEEEMEELLKKGLLFLEQYFEVQVIVGMGECCMGLYGLQRLYRQAQRALGYHFVLGNETIISHRNIRERQITKPRSDGNTMFHIVEEFLQKEKVHEETAKAFVRKLTGIYGVDAEASIETVEYFRYEMVNTLNRVWAGSEVEYFQRQAYVERLMESEHLEEYVERLAGILWETGKEMQDNGRRKHLTRKIKQYVEDNFANAELSVTLIGEVFGMQAAYLSQIFREEYGMLLLNYIANTRVKEAQRMLCETKMTVHEIAESTGFLSDGVFIKTFKKIVGITPGKYRETARDAVGTDINLND